jgi:serine/threonine-protein kinase
MATVYLAVALGSSGFRKLAVVKLIRPQYASDPDLIEMFLDEARLCARLNHPNIVQTYDVGVDDGQHLMAMEYLDGVSFNAAISRIGRDAGSLPFALRAKVLLEVLEGLRYAHELKDYDGKPLQIVHRDVTPHNIFITYEGQVKLLDFGIAKAATSSVQTATGVIKGKLTYMAPEQAFGDPVDARADLYAVGVMLWEALSGRRRFPAGLSDAAMFTRVASGEVPEAPNAAAQGLPEELDALILRALASKREERFQSAAELHAALEAVMKMMPPVSLRELGAMLTAAFSEERQRIRQVIEDQFKQMDTSPTRELPSVVNQLPTVHPPKGTDSLVRDRSSPGPGVAAGTAEEISVLLDGSTTKGLTAAAPRPEVRPTRARLAVWVGLSVAGAIVLATVAPRVLSMGASHSNATAGPPPVAPPAAPAPSAAAVAMPPTPPERGPGAAIASQTRSDEASRRDESSAATATRAGAPGRPPRPQAHPGPGGAIVAEVAPAVEAGAPSSAPSGDIPLRRPPPVKTKVQLDPDNPWP